MNKPLRTIFILIGIAVLLVLLWYIRTIISYVLIAAVLSLIGSPIVNLIDKIPLKFKIPRAISALVTMGLMLLLSVSFLGVFIPLVVEEAKIISSIDVNQVTQSLQEPLNEVVALVEKYDLTGMENINDPAFWESKLANLISFTRITDIFSALIGTLGNIFIAIFSIAFICFFFLKDEKMLYNIISALAPDKYLGGTKNVMANAKKLLTRYFVGILIQVILITTCITIGLSILGIKNALVIGFFAGLMNVIPYVGPLIGMTFGVLVSISTNLHLDFYDEMIPLGLKIATTFLSVQLMDNFIFQPLIFSNSVNAHPLEIFLVILIAGTLAGIAGMILAIPVYAFIRIIAKEFLFEFKIVKSLTKDI